MRRSLAILCAVVLTATALAQQPASPSKAIYVSAADIAALAAKQPKDKNQFPRLIELPPYNLNLEHRVTSQGASVHDREAELFVVIEGTGTVVTGGTLVDAKRANAENSTGSRIEGGVSHKVGKGDFIMVPEGVPHQVTETNGTLMLASIHLPRAKN